VPSKKYFKIPKVINILIRLVHNGAIFPEAAIRQGTFLLMVVSELSFIKGLLLGGSVLSDQM